MPNPAQNELIVRVSDQITTGLEFEVYNTLGELMIARQSLKDGQRIDLSELVQSVYVITISHKSGRISKQFMKI